MSLQNMYKPNIYKSYKLLDLVLVEESTKLRCLFLDCINLFLSFKIKTAGMYDYEFIIIILQKIRQYE